MGGDKSCCCTLAHLGLGLLPLDLPPFGHKGLEAAVDVIVTKNACLEEVRLIGYLSFEGLKSSGQWEGSYRHTGVLQTEAELLAHRVLRMDEGGGGVQ